MTQAPDNARELHVAIRAEPSVRDPNTCKLVVGAPLHSGPAFTCTHPDQLAASPLARRLWAEGGVAALHIDGNTVTVSVAPGTLTGTPSAPSLAGRVAWTELAGRLARRIREHLASGEPAVDPVALCAMSHVGGGPLSTGGLTNSEDEAIASAVQRVLDTEVNPRVAGHGGAVQVVRVEHGRVFVSMTGGCQGCGAAKLTLTQGVEVAIRRAVPAVQAVIDATDHAAGRRPYL